MVCFEYSRNSFRESVHKQAERGSSAEDFGKMLTVLQEVCAGAVEIESHTDKYDGTKRMDPNIKEVHVLLGVCHVEVYFLRKSLAQSHYFVEAVHRVYAVFFL